MGDRGFALCKMEDIRESVHTDGKDSQAGNTEVGGVSLRKEERIQTQEEKLTCDLSRGVHED